MSKKWVLLLGIISAAYLDPPGTSAGQMNPVDGDGPSLQGLDSDTGQMITTNGSGDGSVSRTEAQRSLGSTLGDLVLNFIQRIAAIPSSIVLRVIDWGKEMLTNLTVAAAVKGWRVTEKYVMPRLDEISVKVAGYEAVPENIRSMLMSAHSAYGVMKMLGIVNPE